MDISNENVNDPANELVNENENEIKIIMRQTTYTKEEAEKLLLDLGSVENCIAHYLGIEPKGEPQLSTNQKIFKSIRDFF
jgi:hypothetical protein